MTDGKRSFIGMAFGALGAFVIAALYLGWNFARAGEPPEEWDSRWLFGLLVLWPYFLLYLAILLLPCVLIGGLAGYCLGAEDDRRGGVRRQA